MKKILLTILMSCGLVVCMAQSSQSVIDFIRSTPWNLTDAELKEQYSDRQAILPDTIIKILKTHKLGEFDISSNIIAGYSLGGYNAYWGYATKGENEKPPMMLCVFDPTQTIGENVLQEIDSSLTQSLGTPMEDVISEENNKRDYGNGMVATISNVWQYEDCILTTCVLNFATEGICIDVYIIIVMNVGETEEEVEQQTKEAYRLKFRGIPIDGQLKDFEQKLISLGYTKDYSFEPRDGVGCRLNGLYVGRDCELYVYLTPMTQTVYQVRVIVGETMSWSSLKNIYLTFKNSFTKKYGEPWMLEEKFKYPYEDGDGYEISSLANGRGQYWASFNTISNEELGYIDLTLCASYGMGWLSIDFKDGYNMILKDNEMSDAL